MGAVNIGIHISDSQLIAKIHKKSYISIIKIKILFKNFAAESYTTKDSFQVVMELRLALNFQFSCPCLSSDVGKSHKCS